MLVVGSVEVTAVPDEAVDGVGPTAGSGLRDDAAGKRSDGVGSSVTTDGCAVVSESARRRRRTRQNDDHCQDELLFHVSFFRWDFHLFQ